MGLPKTGTTFLQHTLRQNSVALAEDGVLFPDLGYGAMFRAALELRGLAGRWGLAPEQVEGRWRGLCEQVLAHPGTSVISHEILGGAAPEVISRVAEDLAEKQLHIVVTARDLGRLLPAWWQERVKNKSTLPLERVVRRQVRPGLERARRCARAPSTSVPEGWSPHDAAFWRSMDLGDVLRRWGSVVPAERMHIVMCPPPDADRHELWHRFARAIDLPLGAQIAPAATENQSLGIVEIALLRAVNRQLGDRLASPFYERIVKHWFAARMLAGRDSPRPTCPPELDRPFAELADAWKEQITGAGYRVYGSLDDLDPCTGRPGDPDPDEVPPEQTGDLGTQLISDLLVEVSRLRRRGQLAPPPPETRSGRHPAGLLLSRAKSGVRRRISGRLRP